jgi:hypothetical protein
MIALTGDVIQERYPDVVRSLMDGADRNSISFAEVRVAGGTLILNARRKMGDGYAIEWMAPGDVWGRIYLTREVAAR